MGVPKSALLAILLTMIARTTCNQPFKAEDISRGLITVSNQVFGSALYEAVRSVQGNLIFSPLSTQAIVTMAWLGADGMTARQMESAAGLIRDGQPFFIQGFKNMFSDLRNTSTVIVDIANKLYLKHLNEDMHVAEPFQTAMKEGFQSELLQVNFSEKPEEVRCSINEWVKSNTHGEITDLVREGTVSETTQLIAVNAMYFKGGWAKPFDEEHTTMQPFHVAPDTTVDVPMMHKKEYVLYANNADLEYQAIIMKYRGMVDDPTGDDQTTSMLIILPHECQSLDNIESSVASGNFSQLMNNMAVREVNISLPRFKIESSLDVVSALNELGVTDLFTEGADLSRITSENIHLETIFQKTVVEVTEEGAGNEDATTTDATRTMGSPIEFKVDRPFMFVIRDSFYHVNLVVGRVVQPN